MRGKPCGSHPGIGSLVSADGTIVTPNVGLWDRNAALPSAVYGNSCSGFPSEGICCAPFALIPAPAPAAGSHTPEMSRRGAGAGFSPLKSKSYFAPGCRTSPWPNATRGVAKNAAIAPAALAAHINAMKRFFMTTLPRASADDSLRSCGCGFVRASDRTQHVTIGKLNLDDAPDRLAALDRPHGHRDLVSCLEAPDAPPAVDHVGRITRFHDPAHRLPVLTFYVELQEGVRIGPDPLHDGAFQHKALCRVVLERSGSMVCSDRAGSDRKTGHDSKERDER